MKKEIEVKRNGDYIKVLYRKVVMATYSKKTGKTWGNVKYFKYLLKYRNKIMKSTKFKCPKCKKEIEYVNVVSNCWQKVQLEGNKLIDYGSVQEVLDTQFIECPKCQAKITKYIK